jgi:RNA polymerase sigma-70 factor (ECF subfamily)
MAVAQLSSEAQAGLSERIRTGDPAAEGEFARFFGERVLVMILSRIRDTEAARDLAQEVLLSALQGLRNGQIRQPERLSAYVHGTARNLANNYLRRRGQQPESIPIVSEIEIPQPPFDFENSERRRLVQRAVERLDPTDRRILLMTLVEGAKPGEMAFSLGLTAEAVRTRKSRAVKKVTEIVTKLSRKHANYH